MADIAKLYGYNKPFALKMIPPVIGKDIGITFFILSASSDKVKATRRKLIDDGIQRQKDKSDTTSETVLDASLEEVASFVDSWDWGEHDYNGEQLECTPENVMKVLEAEDWMFALVNEAANDLANFLATSSKSFAKQSAK